MTVSYYFVFDKNAKLAFQEQYIRSVQSNITESLRASEAELEAVMNKLGNQTGEATQYPYFIFSNGRLIGWSDKQFVPSYSAIATIKSPQAIEVENNIFIVTKKVSTKGYELFSFIPLYRHYLLENDFLNSQYNQAIFSTPPAALSLPAKAGAAVITDTQSTPLFYVDLPVPKKGIFTPIPQRTFIFLLVSVVLFSLFVFFQLAEWFTHHKFGRSFFLFLGYTLLIRWLLGVSPFAICTDTLFNTTLLPHNTLGLTLGDKLFNVLVAFVLLGFVSVYIYRSKFFYRILKSSALVKSIVSVASVVVLIFVTAYVYYDLAGILHDSDFQLTYGFDVNISAINIYVWTYYIFLSIAYFLFFHLLLYLFTRIHVNKRTGAFHWLYGLILSLILVLVIDNFHWIYLLIGLLFLVAYYMNLSRFYYIFRFRTSVYFFLFALYFSVLGVSVLLTEESKKATNDMKVYAQTLLSGKNGITEQQLKKQLDLIKTDPKVAALFGSTTLVRERVVQYLTEQYLQNYFGKYATQITVFDANGKNLDILSENETLASVSSVENLSEGINKTAEGNGYKAIVPILNTANSLVGTILIDLADITRQQAGLPEQLASKKYEQSLTAQHYSYGVFDLNGTLLAKNGTTDYTAEWKAKNLKNNLLFSNGIYDNTFFHIGYLHKPSQKVVVISSVHRLTERILSNLSFLFTISIFCFTLALVFYGIRYGVSHHIRLDFSTRLQLYLNAAFLVPLLLVVVITLGVVRSTLLSSQEKTMLATSSNISSTLKLLVTDLEAGKMTPDFFEQEVGKIAKTTKNDINLYNKEGKLSFSTRPLLYEYKLTAPYMPPSALVHIRQKGESEWLQEETIGKLAYKASYQPLSLNNSAHPYSIISVPFFDSKISFNKQLNQVIASILSSFILLFLLLLVVAFLVSRQLTHPLRVITQKIKKTNLNKLNEPLEWDSDDEIGVLMRAYNKMLKKLEENKLALSISEKQTAWREMAKQVAHEIKNPLTPMKLSIQQLQRTLPTEDSKSRERIERALNSLTEQIDNISEIANSFSEFAKMPVPRIESYDIVPVLQKTVDLYAENKNVEIKLSTIEPSIKVLGDRQLMGRIINNLIINGLQSVPTSTKPLIQVKLYKNEDKNFAIFEVKDNGVGIPESIRKKVFIPNFSTKVGGSGLGLAMAKRGIEHVGGNIWFETVEGIGTTFFVDIPLDTTEL